MPKYGPPPQPAPDPRTLFYPVESCSLQPQHAGVAAFFFIPFLLLLAIAAPAMILLIPMCWICCKVNKMPFHWNLPVLFKQIEALCDDQQPTQSQK